MVSSIPAKDIVNVVPGVVSAGGTGLDMAGLLLSESTRIPTGDVLRFASARDVADYFGPSSSEASAATTYFNGYVGSFIKPAFLLFAPFVSAARAGWLRTAPLGMSLDELQALSGTLTINFGGAPLTSSAINLSSASSFSNAASIILAAFTTPGFTLVYDSIADAFLFTSTATGDAASIVYATGTLAAGIKATEATGAVLSQGQDAQPLTEAMEQIVEETQNFVSFSHLEELTNDEIVELAEWTSAQGDRFLFVPWTDDPAAVTNSDTTSPAVRIAAAELSGTACVWAPSFDKAVFILGLVASIDFARTRGRADIAGRYGVGLLPDVTNQTISRNLEANGYNFYGRWATANDAFTAVRFGVVSGPFRYIDSYINQIWLNNAFQLSLMLMLQNVTHIPYNDDGYETIAASITTDILQAVDFGAIVSGVVLSEAQKTYVNGIAGRDISDILFTRGWELSVVDPGPAVRANRGSPVCTFFYTDGGSVQRINLSSLMVQ